MTSQPADELRGAVDRLHDEFSGLFARETIAAVVHDSLDRLAPARIRTYQPLLAYRFARQRLRDSARLAGLTPTSAPVILFVCTQNAGRSQMAAALMEHVAAGRVVVRSAGTEPTADLHAGVVDALAEIGVDPAGAFPKPLLRETVEAADIVVTMGCGDACPVIPGRRYLDWELPDPADLQLDAVRVVRDDIGVRVAGLLDEVLSRTDDQRALDGTMLRLLSDPLRAHIVELLAAEALCTSHLVELTGAKQSNVSNHLRLLRDAGLVTTEPCGRFSYYRLAPQALLRLSEQLADLVQGVGPDMPRRACA